MRVAEIIASDSHRPRQAAGPQIDRTTSANRVYHILIVVTRRATGVCIQYCIFILGTGDPLPCYMICRRKENDVRWRRVEYDIAGHFGRLLWIGSA
jgi:hypothetical protein